MAFDDTFKHSVKIGEEKVFGLIGEAREVLELQPSNFDGPVAEWAELRAKRFGDKIVPRQVYVTRVDGIKHRVAWVYHEGIDMESLRPEDSVEDPHYEVHHITCDCIYEVENEQKDPYQIFACSALQNALLKRNAWVSHVFMYDKIRQFYYNPNLDDIDQSSKFHDLNMWTICDVLDFDDRHPENWMGNVVSGEHTASLLGVMLQLPPHTVRWYAEQLEEGKYVEFDGETITLVKDEDED